MFYVYVLHSAHTDKIYIGFTSNIEGRLNAHNHPSNKGWTKSFMPWTLVYSEEYELKKDAMAREKQLKSARGREFIYSIIQNKM
jgi:putative endonuclease